MTSKERDMMAEGTARRLGAQIEVEGAEAGASTALSTIIRGPDGTLYACAVTVLVHAVDVLPQEAALGGRRAT